MSWQTPPPEIPAGAWELEEILLPGRGVVRGLIEQREGGELTFVEVVRRAGESMFLVRRYRLPSEEVTIRRELPQEERAKLAERIEHFANRKRIESERAATLQLAPLSREGRRFLAYEGEWFHLWSDADDETTRRLIVWIEPMFSALAQIFPPRRAPEKPLRILVFGSGDAYHGYLREQGLDQVAAAAFFSPSGNEIVAGSELGRYAERVREIRQENAALVRRYETMEAELNDRLGRLGRQLRSAGWSGEELRNEIKLRRAAWNREMESVRGAVAAVERRNEEAFAQVAREMLQRLYHEAFHAYLENHLYPAAEFQVPRWLNEGLAQVFEGGRLEVDSLRLDAPPSHLLTRLQADLRSEDPLPLSELLAAPEERFLLVHGGDPAYSRYYLYAWGLAYHLVFHENALQPERLEQLLGAAGEGGGGLTAAVGPLPEFEVRWRRAMLHLRARR